MDLAALTEIRLRELEKVLPLFPPGGRVLEIGAGTGHQAVALVGHGFAVTALDVEGGDDVGERRTFEIEVYDGRHIPYPDGSFDVVYSSNLLEHLVDPTQLLAETSRVLTPEGRAIHVVPTSAWRLWSLLAYYPRVIRAVLLRRRRDVDSGSASGVSSLSAYARAVVPHRHGERGTVVTELVTYTRWRWRALLRQSGFEVLVERPLGLFYTGEYLLGTHLAVPARELLGKVLGSATRVFVVGRRAASQ